MPLVKHSDLPTFSRLEQAGHYILPSARAKHQDIRELHIGFLNMMPDAAMEATERQFYRLVNESNRIAQLYMHPFTLPHLPRGTEAQAYIARYYESFESLREQGLDALIVTGANAAANPPLDDLSFWSPLRDVFEWAQDHVTSTLCSCLASHAAIYFRHGIRASWRETKRWGVYPHHVKDRSHPLVQDTNTIFDVVHSRHSELTRAQFESAGLKVLVESPQAGVHMAVSPDGLRLVCFQGHPEYDSVSLLKEYRREIGLYAAGHRPDYPPFPEHYFTSGVQEILNRYAMTVQPRSPLPPFPESQVMEEIQDTWRDTAKSVLGTWIGLVYQTTHVNRKYCFMEGIDPQNPLGWRST